MRAKKVERNIQTLFWESSTSELRIKDVKEIRLRKTSHPFGGDALLHTRKPPAHEDEHFTKVLKSSPGRSATFL